MQPHGLVREQDEDLAPHGSYMFRGDASLDEVVLDVMPLFSVPASFSPQMDRRRGGRPNQYLKDLQQAGHGQANAKANVTNMLDQGNGMENKETPECANLVVPAVVSGECCWQNWRLLGLAPARRLGVPLKLF